MDVAIVVARLYVGSTKTVKVPRNNKTEFPLEELKKKYVHLQFPYILCENPFIVVPYVSDRTLGTVLS